jgi:hypothetical protein
VLPSITRFIEKNGQMATTEPLRGAQTPIGWMIVDGIRFAELGSVCLEEKQK